MISPNRMFIIDEVVDSFLKGDFEDDTIDTICEKFPKLMPDLFQHLELAAMNREEYLTAIRGNISLPVICPSCHREFAPSDIRGTFDCDHCSESIRILPGEEPLNLIGKTLAGYRIVRCLGRGGYGAVWLAIDDETGERVAIKVSDPDRNNELTIRSFIREAETTRKLNHPRIVTVRGPRVQDGVVFVIADFVDGLTLAEIIEDGAPDFKTIASYCLDIANILDYAHGEGIVHFDIKPSNVIINEQGRAVVVDFGLAREQTLGLAEPTVTRDGRVIGTPEYMSPEQASGSLSKVTGATDIFSTGTVLYHLLTKRMPFMGTGMKLMDSIRTELPLAPRRLDQSIPVDLETICLKCLQKTAGDRYPSAADLAADLDRFVRGEAVLAKPVTSADRVVNGARRDPFLTAALVSIVGMLLAFGVWSRHTNSKLDMRLTDELASKAEVRVASNTPGRRADTLDAIKQAIAIGSDRSDMAWRNLATRALSQFDLQPAKSWEAIRPGFSISPDFQRLATTSEAGGIQIQRISDNQLVQKLQTNRFAPSMTAFSHDGHFLAALYCDDRPFLPCKGGFELWDVECSTLVEGIPEQIHGEAFCFHPTKNVIAFITDGNELRVLDLTTNQQRRKRIAESISHLAFDKTGTKLALSGSRHVYLWNIAIDEMRVKSVELNFSNDGPGHLAWRNDGQAIAVALDDMIVTYDVHTGRQMAVLSGHNGKVARLAFANETDLLLSYGWDQALRIWRSGEVECIMESQGYPCVQFSPDDSQIAGVLQGEQPGISDCVPSATMTSQVVQNGDVYDFIFVVGTPKGTLATAASGGVKLWDSAQNQMIYEVTSRPAGAVLFAPNNDCLATVHRNELCIWPISIREESEINIGLPQSIPLSDQRFTHHACFSADGRFLAVTDNSHSTVVLDTNNGSEIARVETDYLVNTVAISPDGRWLVTATNGQVGHVWNLESPSAPSARDIGGGYPTFSPDGQLLAMGGEGELVLWDTADWKATNRMPRRGSFFCPCAFSSDGRQLAWTPESHTIQLLSLATLSPMAALKISSGRAIQSLTFADNDSRIAATTRGSRLHIWDLRILDAQLQQIGIPSGESFVGQPLSTERCPTPPRGQSHVKFTPALKPTSFVNHAGGDEPHADLQERMWQMAKSLLSKERQNESLRLLESLAGLDLDASEERKWNIQLQLGELKAQNGNLKSAIEHYRQVVTNTDLARPRQWRALALLHLLTGDKQAHTETCHELLERRHQWNETEDLADIVRIATQSPDSQPDLDALLRLAKTINRVDLVGRLHVRKAEYRKALAILADESNIDEKDIAATRLFRAIAAHKVGENDKATAYAAQANEWLARDIDSDSWDDRMEPQTLLREYEEMSIEE